MAGLAAPAAAGRHPAEAGPHPAEAGRAGHLGSQPAKTPMTDASPHPRRLLVLNPNRNTAMTEGLLAALAPRLGPGWLAIGHTCADGPPVIATPETFDAGIAATLRGWQQHQRSAAALPDAVLLGCFGDPGLEALRARCPVPVIGLAEAAMQAAAAHHGRYGILTAGPAWVAMLTQRARDFGCGAELVAVLALPVNGASYLAAPARWAGQLQHDAGQLQRRGARALILGGAAFAGTTLDPGVSLALVDPLAAAVDTLRAGLGGVLLSG